MIRSTVVLFLTISAVAQGECDADGRPNRNSADVSRRAADDGNRWLMLRDDQGKVYRYRNPNNKDDFKVSYMDGRESVVLLPPGILQRPVANPANRSSSGNRKREQPPSSSPKIENRENPSSTADVKTDSARIIVADAVTSESPKTTTPRRVTVERNFTGPDDDFGRENITLARKPPGSGAETAADDRVNSENDRGKSGANSTAGITMILSPIRESESERDRSGPTDNNQTVSVDTGDPILSLVNPTESIKCDGQTDGKPVCGDKEPRHQGCDNEKPREICDECVDGDDDITLLVENKIKFNINMVANSRSPSFQEEYNRGRKPAPDNIQPSTVGCDPGKK